MMVTNPANEELFEFAVAGQDLPNDEGASTVTPWRVLIIDDDEDVHHSTLFALNGLVLFGRPLQFLHAYSAAEAQQKLLGEPELALVLLDVVMETHDAGLLLVDFLRNQAKLYATRVVLRTGQPGHAPEHDTIIQYDINDYKTKSELTQHKLVTTVIAALRAYDQLCVIETGRNGLELIVSCSGGFLNEEDLHLFSGNVITQMAALLRTGAEGLVCAHQNDGLSNFTVMAGAGRFASALNRSLAELDDVRISGLLRTALASGQCHFEGHEAVLYFGQKDGWAMAAYISKKTPLQPMEQRLLSVFGVNLSSALHNYGLMTRLRNDAYVDALLQLPNRTSFVEKLTHTLHTSDASFLLALIDIDDFAEVNDLMGHAYGDKLLQAFARCLMDEFGSDVFLARVSSDSFGLLGSDQCISHQRIKQALEHRVVVAGQPHLVSVTVGFAPKNTGTKTGLDWLKDAGIALKYAKRHHRGRFSTFSDDMASVSRHRTQLLEGLHKAFTDARLFMVYQPQVNLTTGQLIGFESLIRWRTADGRFIPPDQFIPVAEHSGLIVALGDWILQTACRDMRRLKAQGLRGCHMAVNVSVVQFQSDGFLDRVVRTLQEHQLEPRELELEITESVAMLGRDVVEQVLSQLRSLGVAVAIDDFGTGYSSLSYLEQLPVDRIKIDQTFVTKLQAPGGPRIAEMITQLGHKLDLQVLAEGIEDAGAWRALHAMGCDEGQGYFMSRPLDFEALVVWLDQWPTQLETLGVI